MEKIGFQKNLIQRILIFLKQTIFCLFGSLVIFCTNTSGQSHLETKKWENIPFVTRSTGELHLDVFRPSDSKKRPAVLCLHGGFLAKGSKKFMHPLAEDLVARGYVAVSSNYRLTDVAPAPAQLNDVFEAKTPFDSKNCSAALVTLAFSSLSSNTASIIKSQSTSCE